MPSLSRRLVLARAGAVLVPSAPPGARMQRGILDAQQRQIVLVALEATASPRSAVEALDSWSLLAERLQARNRDAALTITVGIGSSLLERGRSRAAAPAGLRPLPAFRGDRLDPARSGGDACLQVCADDPAVVERAVRELLADARGSLGPRWRQDGFLPRPAADGTPRNLLGFKDGTGNPPHARVRALIAARGREVPGWLLGGTFLVVRRIAIDLPAWSRVPLTRQEAIIGRHKRSGAPLGGVRERDHVNVALLGSQAHVALARTGYSGASGPARLLRRGYSFRDDDASGLLFLAFTRDPQRDYVPMQQRLAESDALVPFIEHRASALFAIPPTLRGRRATFARSASSSRRCSEFRLGRDSSRSMAEHRPSVPGRRITCRPVTTIVAKA